MNVSADYIHNSHHNSNNHRNTINIIGSGDNEGYDDDTTSSNYRNNQNVHD